MVDFQNEKLLSNTVKEIIKGDTSKVVQLRNSQGEGSLTIYELCDGLTMMYNDFHMPYCESDLEIKDNIFCIDFCNEGRIEYEREDHTLSYLSHGDIKFEKRNKHSNRFIFPLNHYHGITLIIDIEIINSAVNNEFPKAKFDINKFIERLCEDNRSCIVSNYDPAIKVFMDLYSPNSPLKNEYKLLKALELFMILGEIENPNIDMCHKYFKYTQVEKVKKIHELITQDTRKNYTQEDLSDNFDISISAMKDCFKSIYGKPIYSYLKEYKMNKAALILQSNPKINIGTVAEMFGYENQGKFTQAFKEIRGVTPSEFREGVYTNEKEKKNG